MSYVFHDFFRSTSAPKAASEIVNQMRKAEGTRMNEQFLTLFLNNLREAVNKTNGQGKCREIFLSHVEEENPRGNVTGQISVYMIHALIARIYYIKVRWGWALDKSNELYMIPLSETRYKDMEEKGGES